MKMLCFTVAQHTMFMDSPNNSKHEFVNNEGLNHTNSLEHLLNYENMEEEITNLKLSSYIDIVSLREALGSAKSALSILSFNAQSINAKFDEFRIAIDQINEKHPISIICVQESLLHSNSNLDIFELRDYTKISKGKHCSEHGGLMIYVHGDFDYELFSVYENSTGWENLFIKIHDKKNKICSR